MELLHQRLKEVLPCEMTMSIEDIVDLPLMDKALKESDHRTREMLPCLFPKHPPDVDRERVILGGVLAFIEELHLLRLGFQLADALLECGDAALSVGLLLTLESDDCLGSLADEALVAQLLRYACEELLLVLKIGTELL